MEFRELLIHPVISSRFRNSSTTLFLLYSYYLLSGVSMYDDENRKNVEVESNQIVKLHIKRILKKSGRHVYGSGK